MNYWSQKLPDGERFVLVMNGEAVLDKETGLVWERTPNSSPLKWNEAFNYSYRKSVGERLGWRLPTIEEMLSLVDPTHAVMGLALPTGHPFNNVQGEYWTATTVVNAPDHAWTLIIASGNVDTDNKQNQMYVWCIRGGQGRI